MDLVKIAWSSGGTGATAQLKAPLMIRALRSASTPVSPVTYDRPVSPPSINRLKVRSAGDSGDPRGAFSFLAIMTPSMTSSRPSVSPCSLDPFAKYRERVRDLQRASSAKAPNADAVRGADRVIEALTLRRLAPDRVGESAEGGVAFIFLAGERRYALIESLNEGAVIALLSDRVTGDASVLAEEDVPLSDIVNAVARFKQR